MTTLLVYLMKVSAGLCAVYFFYRVALNKITFYQWNRVYFLFCSLMAFLSPLIDFNALLRGHDLQETTLAAIPALQRYMIIPDHPAQAWTTIEWISLVVGIGMLFRCARLIVNYASLKKVRKSGKLWFAAGSVEVFRTEAGIAPFSFARSIYVNPGLHSETELQQILAHEMVHVRQNHTIDLMAAEIICVVNWFNPFAWWIRQAIRQNLEFVADQQVLTKGFDSKQYQYLLLKVVGTGQAGLAHSFNIYNLKKRIQMMNKVRSPKRQLSRFLFAMPLLLVVLMAFRKDIDRVATQEPSTLLTPVGAPDTVPPVKSSLLEVVVQGRPSGPFQLSLADDNGESIVVIRNKENRIIKAMTIQDWNRHKEENEKQYGPLPTGMLKQKRDQPTLKTPVRITITADSITARPLYLVDGVEQGPGFEVRSIDPNEIEQVSVYKGPHAISKYGEKGKSGAIDIRKKHPSGMIADSVKAVR